METLNKVKNKIVNKAQLITQVNMWKKNNQKIVFTNGCFDILHRGHVEYLAQAADFGNKLIIGINTDISVKGLEKGSSRPIQDEYSRALLIASLEFVDAVILFSESTPELLIGSIIPNVLIKGGDYDPTCTNKQNKKYIVGSDIVKQNGGRVEVIQFVSGFSTTKIEEKIRKA